MPRDVSLSDSKCWNGGHAWVNSTDPVVTPPVHVQALVVQRVEELVTLGAVQLFGRVLLRHTTNIFMQNSSLFTFSYMNSRLIKYFHPSYIHT